MFKSFLTIICLLSLCITLEAQNSKQSEGVITYKEVTKLKIDLPEGMEHLAAMIPSEKTNVTELIFDGEKSLYQTVKGAAKEDSTPFGNGRTNITTMSIGGGENSSAYIDYNSNQMTRSENMMGQRFLISQEVLAADSWKVLDTQKEILGYTCIKAELIKGADVITAWFSPELSIPVGPQRYHNLPGVVLQVESGPKEARRTITATNIEWKEVSNQIIAPKKGKKVSADEFETILDKKLAAFKDAGSDGKVQIKVMGR